MRVESYHYNYFFPPELPIRDVSQNLSLSRVLGEHVPWGTHRALDAELHGSEAFSSAGGGHVSGPQTPSSVLCAD